MQAPDKIVSIAGKKALITGASGFLGSHLCLRLIEMGVKVYGVSRSPHNDFKSDIDWRQGDFADIDSARHLIGNIKPDVIFHLGGLVTAVPDMSLILPTMNSLLVSTVNTLVIASEVGCRRVLLAGSLTEPQRNSDNPPGSPYAAAKWASDAYGRMFHTLYQAPVVILRPFMTYGPKQNVNKLVPHVTISLLKGESPRVSSGNWEADWIYVDDVIDGFIRAAQTLGIDGCTIDLGCGNLLAVRGLVAHILSITGAKVQPTFGSLSDRPYEEVRIANANDTYLKLGWKPKISLQEGLTRTVDWYRAYLDMQNFTSTKPRLDHR